MKGRFQIELTGLCTFVRHPNKKSACVLLVDATGVEPVAAPPGSQPRKSLDRKHALVYHRGFLRFPLHNLAGTNGLASGHDAVVYLDRHNVKLEPSAGAEPFRWNDGDARHLAPLDEVVPGASAVRPAALAPSGSDPDVLARLYLEHGTVGEEEIGGPWRFVDSGRQNGGHDHQQSLAHRIVVDLGELEHLTVRLSSWNGGTSSTIELVPRSEGEQVALTVANLCEENPLEWPKGVEPRPDDLDFKWLYELLDPAARETIDQRRQGGHVPYPRRTGAAALAGENCYSGRAADQAYTIPA